MIKLEPMKREHARQVTDMMRGFYASPALLTHGSEEIFAANVETCLAGGPYLEGTVFTDDGAVVGYSLEAKSFSTEFGCPCVWIEDLYLLPAYRGRGLASALFALLEEKYPGALLRLEAERENAPALRAYRKNGFQELPYVELVRRVPRRERGEA